MTPKAVPAAPLGLLAIQCHADADVEAAAAIVAPTNIAMRKRLMLPSLIFTCEIIEQHEATPQQSARVDRIVDTTQTGSEPLPPKGGLGPTFRPDATEGSRSASAYTFIALEI
jgi:hypothetical protein